MVIIVDLEDDVVPGLLRQAAEFGIPFETMVNQRLKGGLKALEAKPSESEHHQVEAESRVLAGTWYLREDRPGVDLTKPGIYEWEVDGAFYIGKYKHISRPTKEYTRNLANLTNGKPYRPGNKNGFRRIHHALHEALKLERPITLRIIENPNVADLRKRERELIMQHRELGRSLNA